jgi:hypothetical protein
METAMGILARKPEDDRARECAVALSSGVWDSVTRIRCASVRGDTNGIHEFLEEVPVARASACGV